MTRQTDGKSLYEQQEERILAQSDAFISLLTKRGILGDHKIDNDKIRKAQQEKNRKSYHNTQLLLQHYRNIAWLLECLPMDIAKELEEPYEDVDKLIDHMDLEIALGNRKLENRMEGIMRTRLLFDRVNEALTVLSHKPDNGQRLYDVIYHTYIRPDKLSHLEVLDELRLSARVYYRLRQQAISILSIRLWSTPVAGMDFWLDMLTLFENLYKCRLCAYKSPIKRLQNADDKQKEMWYTVIVQNWARAKTRPFLLAEMLERDGFFCCPNSEKRRYTGMIKQLRLGGSKMKSAYWSLVGTACAMIFSMHPVMAATIWDRFSAIMQDIYGQIVAISTIVAVTVGAIALIIRMVSRNQRAVDEATQWLKRIVITWIILNSLGFIVAYLQPLIAGGNYSPGGSGGGTTTI